MDLDVLLMLLLLVSVIMYLLAMMMRRARVLKEVKPRTITVVECPTCGYRETREFTEGDYVLKVVGKCPKCEGRMLVSMIYAEKPRPHVRKGYKSPQPKVSAAPVPAIGSRRRPDSYRTRKLSCSR